MKMFLSSCKVATLMICVSCTKGKCCSLPIWFGIISVLPKSQVWANSVSAHTAQGSRCWDDWWLLRGEWGADRMAPTVCLRHDWCFAGIPPLHRSSSCLAHTSLALADSNVKFVFTRVCVMHEETLTCWEMLWLSGIIVFTVAGITRNNRTIYCV